MSKKEFSGVNMETYLATEDKSNIAMSYTTKHWEETKKMPEATRNLLIDKLYANYQNPKIMEMSVEEVLAL